jgi:hypothetical protein
MQLILSFISQLWKIFTIQVLISLGEEKKLLLYRKTDMCLSIV